MGVSHLYPARVDTGAEHNCATCKHHGASDPHSPAAIAKPNNMNVDAFCRIWLIYTKNEQTCAMWDEKK